MPDRHPYGRGRLVPAILPSLAQALRLGFPLSLLGVLIGEMSAAKAGLGFLLMNATATNDVATLLAVTMLLFAFAMAVKRDAAPPGASPPATGAAKATPAR